MNISAAKFKAYKGLIEGKISKAEYELIVEKIGFFDQLKTGFSALMSDEEGGTYATRYFEKITSQAVNDLKSDLEKIDKIADKLFADESTKQDLKNKFVGMVVGALGVTPEKLQRAATGQQASDSPESVRQKKVTIARNQPISAPENTSEPAADSPEGRATLALVAAVENKPQEKVISAAEERKIKFDAAIAKLYDDTAKETKQSKDDVKKVIDFMYQNKLLTTGYSRDVNKNILLLSENLRRGVNSQRVLFERWQILAGLKQILQEGEFVDLIKNEIEKKKIKNSFSLNDALKSQAGPIGSDAWKDLTQNKDQITDAVRGNPAFPNFDIDKIIDSLSTEFQKKSQEQKPDGEKLSDKAKEIIGIIVNKKIVSRDVAESIVSFIMKSLEKIKEEKPEEKKPAEK